MRSLELANRNLKGMWRDWIALAVNLALPLTLVFVLQALESVDDFFSPASLAPGIAVFGFAMLTLTSAMALAQDRESSLFDRLLTTPLSGREFVVAYSTPYLVVAIVQAFLVYVAVAILGGGIEGNVIWVAIVLLLLAAFYVSIGMIIGTLVSYKAVTGPWTAVLLLTIFGGAWLNLDEIGGVFRTVADWFPFAHGLEAARAVTLDGAGLGDIITDLIWVTGYTAATGGIAVAVFSSQMVED